jgi:UDP-N-acetylmuramate: L-alanyl-gamma-D-glutamyl-meso-diaminopimelate ligase
MRVHFIAIGGSAMHNLAIALHKKGFEVSGSDDEIREPSKSRLAKHGILPDTIGWHPEKISNELDAIILGMHARIDNPELIKAKELGLKIYSYPEYIYEQSKDKKRIVVGGSHGKTTITSMILHVLQKQNMAFDYMVGAQLEGFDTMVQLSDAPIIVIEGDEYLSSPIDRRPKFHLYQPHLAILSGIAWDHINVFPTFENYVEQFSIFIDTIDFDNGGKLFFSENDSTLNELVKSKQQQNAIPYNLPEFYIENGITTITHNGKKYALEVFGEHNLRNIEAAKNICKELGIPEDDFYTSIASFKGANKRLELLARTDNKIVYLDFAHSPSKLKATSQAVKQQYDGYKIIAVFELHTFSSLNAEFLEEYAHCLDMPDEAIVYFNPQTIAHKKLAAITNEQVKNAFTREDLKVLTQTDELKNYLSQVKDEKVVFLLMTSGNFGGMNLNELANGLIG